ncbi:MAG: hypothetical protein LBT05_00715 [Planctomycetaceae bacterium]|jgi:hypothetical protein|nr:hypothetical protein [Planctomycetaceae bacterium]
MTSKKQRTYPEIRQKINRYVRRLVTLLAEKDKIIRQTLPKSKNAEIPLQFNDSKRTISWLGGSMRLALKSYLLVKTLWNGENHKMDLTEIEEIVWEKELQKKNAIEKHTNAWHLILSPTDKKIKPLAIPTSCYRSIPKEKASKKVLYFSHFKIRFLKFFE